MIGRTNACGGSLSKSVIVATAPAGSAVTCSNGSVTKTAVGKASTNIFDTALFPSLTVDNMTFTSSTDGVFVKGVTSGNYERTSIHLPLDWPAIKLSVRAVGLPGDWNLFVGCICTRANGTKDYYDISADNGTTTAELREGDTERVFYVSTNQNAGVSINAFVRVAVVEGTTPPSKVEPYYEGERFIFSGLSDGMWGVVATKDGKTAYRVVTLASPETEYVAITYFSATIHVTYPAGSTCTATGGGTVLRAPNTSGSWDCLVPSSGTWVITAADGTKTKSGSVSISADGQTEALTIAYTMAIDGNAWDGDISNIDTHWREGDRKEANIFTINKIDLTDYDILRFACTNLYGDKSTVTMHVAENTEIAGDPPEPETSVGRKSLSMSEGGTKTGELDVSALSGKYYLAINVHSVYGYHNTNSVHDIVLS